MRARIAARRIAGDDDGVTLVELLVVMTSAIVVALALWAIQDLTLRSTTRVFARVSGSQQARLAMETIENRLHSACVSEGVTPVQAGSTATSVSFISKYGSAAQVTPEKHTIALNTTTGTLIDTTFPYTTGVAPNYQFSSTASAARTLLDNAAAKPGTPVFRYFAYGVARNSSGTAYKDPAGNDYVMLLDGSSTIPNGLTLGGSPVPAGTLPFNSPTTLPTPLSAANARNTAGVAVTMVVGAAGGLGKDPRFPQERVTVQNSVSLRITPVPSDGPLQTVRPCA